jgi:hypothetical protein
MTIDQDFVTKASILTFGGSSLAVLIISTTIQRVASKVWIGFPLITSLIVGGIVAAYSKGFNFQSPLDWLVALVNCCLLFLTATGANEFAAERPAGGIKKQSAPAGKWFVSWFR